MKLNKSMLFIMTLMVLIVGISAVGAADISDNNTVTTTTDSVDAVSSDTSVNDIASATKDTKTVKSEVKTDKDVNDVESSVTTKTTQKSIKTEKTSEPITVNNNSFDDYFTSTGFTENVSDGATISFTEDITRNGTSYVVNKPVNILGNGYTICLNTTSGSYFGNETGSAFIIDNGAAGTNLTNLNFYNTQVFVRNTSNVVVDHINSTVINQRIGSGVGTFSVRDGAINVTVKNSFFHTENNGGSSTLVLAGVYNCTFDNNTVEGVGDVGNLIYLTTYNVQGVSEDDIDINSFNNITNNVVNGPENESSILYGIALTGHDNIIENNTVNVSGQGITTQWAYSDPSDPSNGTNSGRYKGNTYRNNLVLRGASFKATNNSTITGNNLSGSLTTGINATVKNNVVNGSVTVANGSNITNNVFRSTVTVSGSNVFMEGNSIHGLVTVNKGVSNATIQNNNLCKGIVLKSGAICNETNNDCDSTCNCGVTSCSCSGCIASTTKSLKTADEDNVVYVNADNYSTYFTDWDDSWLVNEDARDKTLVIGSDVPSLLKKYKTFYFLTSNGHNFTIVGANNNVTFYNQYFCVNTGSSNINVKLANLTFVYDPISSRPPENNYEPALFEINTNAIVENVTFKATISEFSDDIPEGSYLIKISGGTSVYRNCTFDFTIPTTDISWDVTSYTGQPRLVPIIVEGGKTQFINNTISMKESTVTGNGYATMEPFLFKNSGNAILNNTIYLSGKYYLYGMYFSGSSNNVVSGNNITVNGSKYTNGIYFSGTKFSNNTVSNNFINLTSGNNPGGDVSGNVAEDSGYAINMENMGQGGTLVDPDAITIWNLTVANNTIVMSGYNPYGIELFGAIGNTIIANNTINATGHTPSAITMMGYNTTIEGNDINLVGETNLTESSADWFRPTTTGIYLKQGLNNTVRNNNIRVANGTGVQYITQERNTTVTNNTIIVDNEITVLVDSSSTGAVIENNVLVASSLVGDESVSADLTQNTVSSNVGLKATTLTIALDSTDVEVGDSIVVDVSLVDEDNNAVQSVPVVLTIGDDTYDLTTDANGLASYTYIPTKAQDGIKVVASFSGKYPYDSSESNEETVYVSKIETSLDSDPESVLTVGKPTTFTGTLTSKGSPLSGATIKIYLNGSLIGSNVTDDAGKFSYVYVPASEGTGLSLVIAYEGDDKYLPDSDDRWVDVEKTGTVVSLDSVGNAVINGTVVVTGSLTEMWTEKAVAIAGAAVKVVVAETFDVYSAVTGDDGTFAVMITAPGSVGTYTVAGFYDGSDVYYSSDDYTTFDVEVLGTSVAVDPVNGINRDTVSLRAVVMDERNKTVTGGKVSFAINGTVVGIADVNNGVATSKVTALRSWDGTGIVATYAGNEVYQDSVSDAGNVSVALRTPTLTLINTDLSGKNGETVTFMVQVSDGNYLVNEGKVSFKLNGVSLKDANGGTTVRVVNGIATFDYVIPDNFSAKDYALSVVYGDNDYERGEAAGTLTVVRTNSHMEGNVLGIASNGTATLSVKVFGEDNNLVERNFTVSIKVNGKTVLGRVTVEDGYATFGIDLIPSSTPYNITIVTGDNSQYYGSKTTVVYQNPLPKYNTNIVTKATVGKTSTALNINLRDDNGNAISGKTKVSVKVDGKTQLSNQVAVNGVLNCNITTPTKSGNHTVTVVSAETTHYASASADTVIKV